MRTYFTKIRARIVELSKDEQEYCSSRVITAKLEDRYGEIYRVTWGISPAVFGPTVQLVSRNLAEFEQAWDRCKKGDEVWLYHSKDYNTNYFVPIDSK